jgi:predicted regulator of Ras-like GTPase activity (Roadblock/LC7/MglB family)
VSEEQGPDSGPLTTVTHARLRVAQGDFAGARRVLEALLVRRPGDAEVQKLIRSLPGTAGPAAIAEALRAWLARIPGFGPEADTDGDAMVLDDVLSRVHEVVDGIDSVFVVGMDGMIVAGSPSSDASAWEWIVASYAGIVRKLGDANREGELDPPTELVVGSDKAVLVFRQVTPEYGLLAAVDPDSGALGRTRFELRKAAVHLVPELAD